jgi:hypothetical protein
MLNDLFKEIKSYENKLSQLLDKVSKYPKIQFSHKPHSQEVVSYDVVKFIKEHEILNRVTSDTDYYGELEVIWTLYFEDSNKERLFNETVKEMISSLSVEYVIEEGKQIKEAVINFVAARNLYNEINRPNEFYVDGDYFEGGGCIYTICFTNEDDLYEFCELFPNGIVENNYISIA